MRLMGEADGSSHVLVELVAERQTVKQLPVLFVQWLSLRNPRAKFSEVQPALPGQDVPGLGLAKEAIWVLALMAKRLGLLGVAFRPSQYHMAYMVRHVAKFEDPTLQRNFEALQRDLGQSPLLELTHAIEGGRVTLDGEPYRWEPGAMVAWLDPELESTHRDLIARTEKAARFRFVEPQAPRV
jgi:hypothetical protein